MLKIFVLKFITPRYTLLFSYSKIYKHMLSIANKVDPLFFHCAHAYFHQVGLPLALWQDSGPKFKRIPKVNEVSTNHWVFLRCDWSPISS